MREVIMFFVGLLQQNNEESSGGRIFNEGMSGSYHPSSGSREQCGGLRATHGISRPDQEDSFQRTLACRRCLRRRYMVIYGAEVGIGGRREDFLRATG